MAWMGWHSGEICQDGRQRENGGEGEVIGNVNARDWNLESRHMKQENAKRYLPNRFPGFRPHHQPADAQHAPGSRCTCHPDRQRSASRVPRLRSPYGPDRASYYTDALRMNRLLLEKNNIRHMSKFPACVLSSVPFWDSLVQVY